MPQLREQKQRIEDIKAARYITGALRDISAIELKNLKKKFQQNDVFYSELKELFQLVWRIATSQGLESTMKKKEAELFLAYTTNRHFYGSLNNDVIREFTKGTDSKSKCLIVGDTGKQIWMSKAQKRQEVSFLSFKEDEPTAVELDALLEKVKEYEHVYVFYPGFTSVFKQDVDMTDITYKPSVQPEGEEGGGLDVPQYLLEPDLSEMVDFFNTQVRYALLERLLLETQISRVAARLVKMDTADQNADELIKVEARELRHLRTSFSSRRMLETVVGFIQWHNRKTQLIAQ